MKFLLERLFIIVEIREPMRRLVLRGAIVLENIQIFNCVDKGRSGRESRGRLGRRVNSGGSRERSGSGRHCNGCGNKGGWHYLNSTLERHFFSSSRRRTRVRLTRIAVDGSFRESPSVQVQDPAILYQYDHLFWSRVTEADEEKSFSELSRSQFFLKSWSAVSRKCEISLLKICKKIGKIFSTSYPNTSVHLARRICS